MGSTGVWWFIAIAMIVIGLILILTGRDKEVETGLEPHEIEHKDGVPILPRSQRQLDENGQPMAAAQSSQTASDVAHKTTSSPVSSTTEATSVNTHTSDVLSNLADVAASRTTQTAHTQSTPSAQQNTQTTSAEEFEVELDDKSSMTPITSEPVLPKVVPAIQTATPKQEDMPVIQKDFENVVSVEFDEETPELDDYFQYKAEESLRNNDALLGHKKTVTIVVSPRDTFTGISGKIVMSLVRQYAMKYGVLNMFHRYENPEGTGMLWFSMLGVTIDGVESFDLVTLPEMNYRGLALFLSLPHPQAVRGFDSMIQVAKAIADELDADIHDEAGYLLDNAQLQALRAVVSEYKLGQ